MHNFNRDGFDFLPGALIEIDLSKRSVIYMNRIAFSLFEYTQADIDRGLPLRDIFQNDSEYERSIRVAESFGLDAYQHRKAYSRYEKQDLYDFMMVKQDGSEFFAECQGSFVLDENQVPVGARIYIRDLSEQRLIEASHIENEEKYRTLVENSSDLIFLIDPQGVVLSVNKATSKYLKRSRREIEGKNVAELFPAQTTATLKGYLNKSFISGKRAIYETPMPTTNKQMWVNTSINPVRDIDGNITAILGVSRDITHRKRSEERLEQALVEAKNANKLKSQFISNITHEIRTPLTSITGFTTRLRESLGDKLNPEVEDFFKFIQNGSKRLLNTVDAIIKVSQVEAGTLPLTPKCFNLIPMLQVMYDKLLADAIAKGIELEYKNQVEDDEIWADENSVYEAINNILENAIKYTQEGGISIILERVDGLLTLNVADTGIGISDEYRERLFQLFSQESEGLAKEYQGIGLGLALTKRYLDMNKILISVQSEKGRGSTFTLTFPHKERD